MGLGGLAAIGGLIAAPFTGGLSLGLTAAGLQYEGLQAQKAAGRESRRLREIQATRTRRRQFREARLARAQTLAQAGAAGVPTGASGVQGAISSTQAQLGFNLSFLDQTNTIQENIAGLQEEASIFQAGAGIAGTAFAQAGGFETIFRKTPGTT